MCWKPLTRTPIVTDLDTLQQQIAELPERDRLVIETYAKVFREIVKLQPGAVVALALVAAEVTFQDV